MAAFLVTAAFALIAIFTVPRLVKNREYKDLAVFSALFLCGYVLALLHALGVDLPSPAKIMISIYNAFGLHF